jgi:hypothetical protein
LLGLRAAKIRNWRAMMLYSSDLFIKKIVILKNTPIFGLPLSLIFTRFPITV